MTPDPHFRRSLVVGLVMAVLAGVTVLVHHQTDDVIMIGYWYFGVSVVVACLVSFVIGRRYKKSGLTRAFRADRRLLCSDISAARWSSI